VAKDTITQGERDAIHARLNSMKAASGGSKDKLKHDAAVNPSATWREKSVLVTEAIRAAPDLRRSKVAEVVQEWYDGETGDREKNKKAAGVVADEDPRETPVLTSLKDLKNKGATPPPPAPPPHEPGKPRKEAT